MDSNACWRRPRIEPWCRRHNEPAIKTETLAPARRLSPPRWLTEGAADTSEMAQFGVGGNRRARITSRYRSLFPAAGHPGSKRLSYAAEDYLIPQNSPMASATRYRAFVVSRHALNDGSESPKIGSLATVFRRAILLRRTTYNSLKHRRNAFLVGTFVVAAMWINLSLHSLGS